jgi:MOSC domain-containing protein YiiM
VGRTSIRKRAVRGPVAVRTSGLAGDTRSDTKYHGGPENAVYVYAREDLDHFEGLLGQTLPDGQFGENLTTSGIDVNAALLGERWRVGTALVEVSSVRTPCVVFQNWMGLTGHDDTGWIKRFTAELRPGPYLSVVEEGVVEAGDPVTVEHRPDQGVSVIDLFRALRTDRSLRRDLLSEPALPDVARALLA